MSNSNSDKADRVPGFVSEWIMRDTACRRLRVPKGRAMRAGVMCPEEDLWDAADVCWRAVAETEEVAVPLEWLSAEACKSADAVHAKMAQLAQEQFARMLTMLTDRTANINYMRTQLHSWSLNPPKE